VTPTGSKKTTNIEPAVRMHRLIKPSNKIKYSSIVLVLTVFTVLLLSTPPTLRAQEQQPREIQQTAGPYDVGVLTERSNLSVGRARFIITINDQATGEPVDGAQIVIRIKHQIDGTEGWAAAFGVPKFPGTYHAQTKFDSPGSYLISLEIQGPLGDGSVLLEPLYVPEVKGFTSGSFVFIGLTLVLASGAGYLWWSTARQNKRRASVAGPPGESTSEAGGGPAGRGHQGTGNDVRE
jgi:hypothetical protein